MRAAAKVVAAVAVVVTSAACATGRSGGGGAGAAGASAKAGSVFDDAELVLIVGAKRSVVRQRLRVQLRAGENRVFLSDVPAGVDPAGVRLVVAEGDDAAAGATRGALVIDALPRPAAAPEAALQAARGQTVRVRTRNGAVEGKLLETRADALVIDDGRGGGARQVPLAQVTVVELPGGEPVAQVGLAWTVRATRPGERRLEARYETDRITWQGGWTVIIDQASGRAEVEGRVQIANDTAVELRDARVWLAGEEVSAGTVPAAPGGGGEAGGADDGVAGAIYALPQPLTLAAASVTPTRLLAARDLEVRRTLLYDAIGEAGVWTGRGAKRDRVYPQELSTQVEGYLEITLPNREPLPGGTIEFLRRGRGGHVERLATRVEPALAASARLRAPSGEAGKLVGRRVQIELDDDGERRRLTEEIEVTIENQGDADAEVTVIERLARHDAWRITWWSVEPEKDSPRAIRFRVRVRAGGETRLRYRVVYFL